MVQGTTSDAGKSTLVAGLCRVMHRRGVRVAPFKPQNMSLNSAVGADGGEMGRAQALQAQAAGIEPTSDMNPVLLKPNSDTGAQVIVHGRAVGELGAAAYHDYKRIAREAVLASYERLAAAYELILVEGAGSPAEINLRAGDIANMGFAEAIDCPVVLIADIDRGLAIDTQKAGGVDSGYSKETEVTVKIRYSHPGTRATVMQLEDGRAHVRLRDPQRAVTPGQATVFYDGDIVLGGGWICRNELIRREALNQSATHALA